MPSCDIIVFPRARSFFRNYPILKSLEVVNFFFFRYSAAYGLYITMQSICIYLLIKIFTTAFLLEFQSSVLYSKHERGHKFVDHI